MNRQIIKNIGFNGLSFISNMLITIALTPYLVKYLGIVAYGFIPLTAIFTAYIGIITESLTISINRNLTKALQSERWIDVKEIYSTSLITMLLVVLILIMSLIYPIWHLESIIHIPETIIKDVKYLFVFLALSFLLSLISSVFSVAMYSRNRVDLMQISSIIRNVTRAILIFLLFTNSHIGLFSVGLATLIGSVVSVIYCYVWKCKLIPTMNLDFKAYKLRKIRDITNMGGWLLVNQLGFVLFMKVDLLLINKFLGPEDSAYYSIAMQFSEVLRIFAGVISGVLGPAILILYSRNDFEKMINLTKGFVKFLSMTIAIPIIIICVWSEEILLLWMGENYVRLSPLVWLLTLPLIINIGVQPLFSIQVAMNKVRFPAILNVSMGTIGVICAIFLLNYTSLGSYGVALSSIIALTIKNAVITPYYTSGILKINRFDFIHVHIKTLFFSILSVFILFHFKSFYRIESVIQLFGVTVFVGFVMFIFSLSTYSKNERKDFLEFIRSKK